MPQKHFTPDELRERLSYCPDTGKLTWKKCRSSVRIGTEAKSLDLAGYVQLNIAGSVLKGHRVAWAIHHGEWPSDHIDHINGVRNDNRIENLRVVSGTTNTQNKRNGSTKNNSGFIGAYKCADGWFTAQIVHERKKHYLGRFRTGEEAHAAYVKAKRVLHAGCTI